MLQYILQFNEEARSPFVKKYKTIIHPGEVWHNYTVVIRSLPIFYVLLTCIEFYLNSVCTLDELYA